MCDFGLSRVKKELHTSPTPPPHLPDLPHISPTKVCDFGLSRVKKETAVITARMGSPQWSAPEILRGISPLHLPRISPASPLHLPCISPASRLHLPSGRRPRSCEASRTTRATL